MSDEAPVLHGHTGWTKCRSCGASIVFAIIYTSGKKSPFQRDDKGEWILENGMAKHVGPPKPQADMFARKEDEPARWTSHFPHCPQASEWRGRK